MRDVESRVKKGTQTATEFAVDVGKKAAKKVALVTDSMLVKLGDSAKKRQRSRRTKSALKTAGKVALVIGAGAATAIGARRILARNNSRGRKRK